MILLVGILCSCEFALQFLDFSLRLLLLGNPRLPNFFDLFLQILRRFTELSLVLFLEIRVFDAFTQLLLKFLDFRFRLRRFLSDLLLHFALFIVNLLVRFFNLRFLIFEFGFQFFLGLFGHFKLDLALLKLLLHERDLLFLRFTFSSGRVLLTTKILEFIVVPIAFSFDFCSRVANVIHLALRFTLLSFKRVFARVHLTLRIPEPA